jgi:hypothetical protein
VGADADGGAVMIYERAMALVEALRSGKYVQTRGKLREAGGEAFCCLGVACEISNVVKWNGVCYIDDNNDTNEHVLPYAVRDWLGAKETNPGTDDEHCLASMNDAGASFATIADFIEQHWEVL